MARSAAIARLLRRAKEETGGEAEAPGGPPAASDGAAKTFGPPPPGPAAIFASIRSGGIGLPLGDLPEDDGTTFVLLSQLDRMWRTAQREA